MNFYSDILIPFVIGVFGIYFAYSLFEILLTMSFGFINPIKDKFKNSKTLAGKTIALITIIIVAFFVSIFLVGNFSKEQTISIRVAVGVFGFFIFIAFLDSPLHKKFRNKDKT